jgi:indolepyruvate ferredoxin oxidoreductase beta subunit
VESTVLLGGWKSPKMGPGEADVLLGFEPLETLRGLHYLRPGGTVISSTEPVPPVAVSMGQAEYPELDTLQERVRACAGKSVFLPARSLGMQAGAVQSGNLALLAAACASGMLPLDVEALKDGVRAFLKPKLVDLNLRAIDLGVEAAA